MTKLPDKNAEFVSQDSPQFTAEESDQPVAAWEEVAEGRYMPRRVRGSCHGRALG